MAMTAAERQSAYRSRRNDGDGDRRINTWVSTNTHFALIRLSKHYSVTKKELLERLMFEADDAILKSLEMDTPEWDAYLNVTV